MKKVIKAVSATLILSASAPAPAVMPVVDAQSVFQLRQQIAYWQQQLNSMRDQAQTLQSQLRATTGARGMGNLLLQTTRQRNYLPTSDASTDAALNGNGPQYPLLRELYTKHLSEQRILSDNVISRLNESERKIVREQRANAAATESLFAAALANASDRYQSLQSLIDQIDQSSDSKAIQDLQGRIAGEQMMLENDRIKVSSMATWASARTAAAAGRAVETALVEQGSFSSRFHPAQR
jgi:type IV secretion system protein VirB5